MIFYQRVAQSGGFFHQGRVQLRAAKGHVRLRKRGLQCAPVADAGQAARLGENEPVQREHFVQAEVPQRKRQDGSTFLRQTPVQFGVLLQHVRGGLAKSGGPAGAASQASTLWRSSSSGGIPARTACCFSARTCSSGSTMVNVVMAEPSVLPALRPAPDCPRFAPHPARKICVRRRPAGLREQRVRLCTERSR